MNLINILIVMNIILSIFIDKVICNIRPEVTLLNVFTQPLIFEESTTSAECHRDIKIYNIELENYTPWALQMYDASAKIPTGIITGNIKQLGNYDECLRIKSIQGFNGKACSGSISFNVTKKISSNSSEHDLSDLLMNMASASGIKNWSGKSADYDWLFCVPSTCSHNDVASALKLSLNSLENQHNNSVTVNVNVAENNCHTLESDRPIYTLIDWIYISLMVLVVMLVLVSTTYDAVKSTGTEKPDFKGLRHALLTSFSIYTNGKFLLSTKLGGSTIRCLDGLRFLSICWIILGHSCYQQIIGPQLDFGNFLKMHESWSSMLVLNGNIATDIFFLLSGILLMYSELGRKEREPESYKLNVKMLYFHRYLRLTPAYAIVVGFYATILYKMGSGPHWNRNIAPNQDHCIKNWWTNLLYINNYVGINNSCMSQTWYLAVDMQLVWISPIFLYPIVVLGIKHIASISVLLIGLGVSILSPFLVTYFEHLYGTMVYYQIKTDDLAEVYIQVYTRVYARAGPYIIGLILGYYLRSIRHNPPKISTVWIVGGWILSISMGLFVLFAPRQIYFPDYKYNAIESAFYAGFHRSIFALSVGWIIFATVLGRAGFFGCFLNWSGWMPLGRLTYSAYLTHFIIILYNAGNVRTPLHISSFEIFHNFVGSLGLTMFLAVILCLFFELPFLRLDKLLTQRREPRPFSKQSFAPQIITFGSCDSTKEIYRSSEDITPTISRIYVESISTSQDNISTCSREINTNQYY